MGQAETPDGERMRWGYETGENTEYVWFTDSRVSKVEQQSRDRL